MTVFIASQRSISGTVGGVETFVRRLLEAFPHLCLIEPGSMRPGHSKAVRLRVLRKGPRSLAFTLSLWWWLVRHRRGVSLLVLNRVEHVLAAMASGLAGRTVMVVHGSSKYADLYFGRVGRVVHRFLEAVSVRRCREVCVLMGESPPGLPHYRVKYPESRTIVERRVLVPSMPLLVNSKDPRETPLVIGYLGRLDEPVKRISALAFMSHALENAAIPHKVQVLGEGADAAILRAKAQELGVHANFEYGVLPDVTAFQGGWHIGIVASRFEGMCLAALELLAAGIPVVASDVGEMRNYATWGAVTVADVGPEASPCACGETLADAVLQVRTAWPRVRGRALASRALVAQGWYAEALVDWEASLREGT